MPSEANGNRQIMMQLGKRTAKQEIPESGWVYYHFIVGGKGNILEDLLGGTKYNVSFDLNVDASSTADKRSVYIRGNSKPLDRFALLRGLPEPGEEHTQELSQANFFADYKTVRERCSAFFSLFLLFCKKYDIYMWIFELSLCVFARSHKY